MLTYSELYGILFNEKKYDLNLLLANSEQITNTLLYYSKNTKEKKNAKNILVNLQKKASVNIALKLIGSTMNVFLKEVVDEYNLISKMLFKENEEITLRHALYILKNKLGNNFETEVPKLIYDSDFEFVSELFNVSENSLKRVIHGDIFADLSDYIN